VWLTILVIVLLAPVLLDLWAYTFTEIGARMEHGVGMAIMWPLEVGRALGLLSTPEHPVPLSIPLGIIAAGAAVFTALARKIDPKPGEPPILRHRIAAVPWFLLTGPPLLVGALTMTVMAGALDPQLFVTILAAGLIGGLVGQRKRRKAIPWERSLTGLPPAFWPADHLTRWGILFGGYSALLLGTTLIGLPFDEQPMRTALLLDQAIEATGPQILPWAFGLSILLISVLAPPTRRASDLMSWEPWVAGLVGGLLTLLVLSGRGWATGREAFPLGFGLGYLGTLMAGGGVPWLPRLSLNPLRAVGRLWLPMAAAVAVSVHVMATGFLGCESIDDDPALRLISKRPGAIDIEYTDSLRGPALFAIFRAEGQIARFQVKGDKHVGLKAEQLPLEALRDPTARAYPTLLGRGPGGSLFVISEVIPATGPSTTALVELDPADSGLLAVAEDFDLCGPSSWTWNPVLAVGLLGCRDDGQLLLYERHLKSFISRESLRGAREVQAVVVDPNDGSVLTLARRESPFLTRFDLTSRVPVNWQFVGLFNRRLGLHEDQVILPRFLGRQILLLDRDTLRPQRSRPAGFALASLVYSETHDRAFSGSMVDGYIYSVPVKEEAETKRIRAGGWISDLALSSDARTLYASSMCGIAAINLELWMED
jgi:hypothetical protein